MPVHVYGRVCDMGTIADLAEKYEVGVIEDMAEAHCTKPHPYTHAACWSFYRNKVIAGEEGGMVYFRQKHFADTARQLRCQGFTDAHDFTHIPRGHNYRLANCLATKVLDSIDKGVNNILRRLAAIAAFDRECPPEWKMPNRITPWVYDIRIPGISATEQDWLITELRKREIEVRHGFKPLSLQEEYRGKCDLVTGVGGDESNALVASREVLYFPIWPSMAGVGQAYPNHVFHVLQSLVAERGLNRVGE